jgi:hypothetical protein
MKYFISFTRGSRLYHMIGENVLKTKVEMVRANNIWKIPHVNLFLYKQAHKQKVKICSKSLGYLNVHDVSINFNERGGWNQVQIQGFFSTNQSFMVDYVVPILQLCLRRGGGGYRIPGLLQSN